MIPQHGIPIAQGAEMRDRTLSKTSATTGHLEDQSLDLDARTMAILGKKQRLNVRLFLPQSLSDFLSHVAIAKFWICLASCLFNDFARVLGSYCSV